MCLYWKFQQAMSTAPRISTLSIFRHQRGNMENNYRQPSERETWAPFEMINMHEVIKPSLQHCLFILSFPHTRVHSSPVLFLFHFFYGQCTQRALLSPNIIRRKENWSPERKRVFPNRTEDHISSSLCPLGHCLGRGCSSKPLERSMWLVRSQWTAVVCSIYSKPLHDSLPRSGSTPHRRHAVSTHGGPLSWSVT